MLPIKVENSTKLIRMKSKWSGQMRWSHEIPHWNSFVCLNFYDCELYSNPKVRFCYSLNGLLLIILPNVFGINWRAENPTLTLFHFSWLWGFAPFYLCFMYLPKDVLGTRWEGTPSLAFGLYILKRKLDTKDWSSIGGFSYFSYKG